MELYPYSVASASVSLHYTRSYNRPVPEALDCVNKERNTLSKQINVQLFMLNLHFKVTNGIESIVYHLCSRSIISTLHNQQSRIPLKAGCLKALVYTLTINIILDALPRASAASAALPRASAARPCVPSVLYVERSRCAIADVYWILTLVAFTQLQFYRNY